MHIRRPPSFFFAKRMGAPYGPLAGSILPESKNSESYFLSSVSSTESRGYNLRLGGAAPSSFKGMECSNLFGHSDLSTGYTGSEKTSANFVFNFYNCCDARSANLP